MTKSKNTKRALLMSVLSMLLCVSMLVSSTFAWFTDSVTSGNNRIVAGNLDVGLYYNNASTNGDWKDANKIEAKDPKFFVDQEGNDILWEPGVMAYTYFKVTNEGSLALKYKLTAIVDGCNNLKGHKLSEVIKFAVLEGKADLSKGRESEALTGLTYVKFDNFEAAGNLGPKPEDDESSDIFTVVAYWEPDAQVDVRFNLWSSEKVSDFEETHNNCLWLDIGVRLDATQDGHESDSFGTDYDANVPLEGPAKVVTVKDQETLDAAFAEIYASDDTVAKIVLDDDVHVKETLNVKEGKDITIDLAGHSLDIERTGSDDGIVVQNGTLTVTNSGNTGKFIFSSGPDGAAFFVDGGDSVLNLEDVSVKSSMAYNGVIYAEGTANEKATVNLNSGANISMECETDSSPSIVSGICASNANVNIHEGASIQVSAENLNNLLFCINAEKSDISMTGGELNVHSYGTASSMAAAMVLDNCNVDISGGVINLTGNREIYGVLIQEGTVNMTGGTIHVDAKDIKYYAGAFGIDNRTTYVKVDVSGGTINVNTTFAAGENRGDRAGYAVCFAGNEPYYAHSDVTVSGTTQINLTDNPDANAYNYMCNYDDSRFVDAR